MILPLLINKANTFNGVDRSACSYLLDEIKKLVFALTTYTSIESWAIPKSVFSQ